MNAATFKEGLKRHARAWFVPRRPGAPLSSGQRAAVRLYVTAAEARARAAPGSVEPATAPVSVGLQRDAVICLLRALHHVRHPDGDQTVGPVPVETLREVLEETALLPAFDERSPRAWAALGATDVVAFEQVSAEDLEQLRQTFEMLVSRLRGRLDLRTDAYFRWLGLARAAVVALLLLWGLVSLGGALFKGEDIARGKPVSMSSRQPGTPDPSGLVDGVVGGGYGAHTLVGGPQPPWIAVDLKQSRHVRRVVVYNRGDVNLDQCLPFSVSVSEDGRIYKELAHRDTHFGSGDFLSSPWTIKCDVHARFVRVEAKDYVALSELEVFE